MLYVRNKERVLLIEYYRNARSLFRETQTLYFHDILEYIVLHH